MILLWVILDQKKIERESKVKGLQPALTMGERLNAYLMCIALPILAGIACVLAR